MGAAIRNWLIGLSCLLLAACSSVPNYAPVSEATPIDPIPKSGVHRVAQGETVYEIAWRYGLDYRYIEKRNAIKPASHIHSGQVIALRGRVAEPVNKEETAPASPAKPGKWVTPAKGRIIVPYSVSHKGINIAGYRGEPIYAAAAGKVVYAGAGLRGYGNLIIIKHNDLYLSAYAHNQVLLVKEGQYVKQGQKIGEMGDTGTNRVMLHFEIRRAGQPINPTILL